MRNRKWNEGRKEGEMEVVGRVRGLLVGWLFNVPATG